MITCWGQTNNGHTKQRKPEFWSDLVESLWTTERCFFTPFLNKRNPVPRPEAGGAVFPHLDKRRSGDTEGAGIWGDSLGAISSNSRSELSQRSEPSPMAHWPTRQQTGPVLDGTRVQLQMREDSIGLLWNQSHVGTTWLTLGLGSKHSQTLGVKWIWISTKSK